MIHPNEPAYPCATKEILDFPGLSISERTCEVLHQGLTKRELFAAMVMQGRLSSPYGLTGDPEFAKDCVTLADELIEALNQ